MSIEIEFINDEVVESSMKCRLLKAKNQHLMSFLFMKSIKKVLIKIETLNYT